jgi:tetratricopeptide (TPR) repeat protein
MHPTYISGHNVLGRIYLDSGRYAEAHEQFSKVLDLDPQNLIALRALGDLALEEGQLDSARAWYERILAIDPRNEQAQEGLAAVDAGGEPEAEPAPTAGPPAQEEAAAPEETFEIEEFADDIERSLDVDAAAAEIEVKGTDELGPVEGLDMVEGLVNKETMSRTDDEVAQDPEVESASKLADKEFLGDRPPTGEAAMPWDDSADDAAAQVGGLAAEPDATPAGTEGSDVFTESTLDGLAAADPAFDLLGEGDGLDFDLEGMDDWTPGFMEGDAPAGEQAEPAPVEGGLEGDGDFSIDFVGSAASGTPSSEGPTDLKSPEVPAAGKGLVTETMAELYVDQGLFDEALRVYRELAESRPGDERIAARITELEQRVEQDTDSASDSFGLGDLLELTEPRAPAETDAGAEPEPVAAAPEAPEPTPPPEPAAPEPVAVTEPTFAEETTETATPEPAVAISGDFAFEDEAPVAGFEHLDPFAASFEVMAKPDEVGMPEVPEAEPAAPAPAAEAAAVATEDWEVTEPAEAVPAAEPEPAPEPMPAEPFAFEAEPEPVPEPTPTEPIQLESEPEPIPEPTPAGPGVFEAEPEPSEIEFVQPPEPTEPEPVPAVAEPIAFEPPPEPDPVPITLDPEPEFGVVEPTDSELPPEPSLAEPVSLQTPSESAGIDPIADIRDVEPVELEPAETAPADDEPLGLQPVGIEPVAPDATAEQPEAVSIPSIEDYLSGLLTYKPGQGKAETAPPATTEEPTVDGAQAEPSESDSRSGGDDEDLDQFQEWLKGLRT